MPMPLNPSGTRTRPRLRWHTWTALGALGLLGAASVTACTDDAPAEPPTADAGAPTEDAAGTHDVSQPDAGAQGDADAQTEAGTIPPEPQFVQYGSDDDVIATAVAVDSSGNVFAGGGVDGELVGQTGAGGMDAFLVKLDSARNVVWAKQFGSDQDDWVSSIAVDASGSIFVAGSAGGTLDGQTDAAGEADAFLVKLDSDGNVLWTKQFGTDRDDGAESVALDANGNVFVVGTTMGAFDGQMNAGGQDGFARKLDDAGNELWTIQFGSNVTDLPWNAAVDKSGALLVAASGGEQAPGVGPGAFVQKFDGADGSTSWARSVGATAQDYATAISVDASNNVFLVGETHGAFAGENNAGGTDAFLQKLDSAGVPVWAHQFGSGENDSCRGVAIDGAGNIVVAGNTKGELAGQTNAGGWDVFVRKYDPAGNPLWTEQLGSNGDDHAYALAVSPGGGIFVAGETAGALPGWTNAGGSDAYVIFFGE